MVEYHSELSRIAAKDLQGFFQGWPNPPSPEVHLRLLENSTHFVVAVPPGERRVIGYVTALSDGVLSAYISQLEVLPDHRGRGIGSALVRNLLEQLEGIYMIDLVCDADVQPFYEALDFRPWNAMIRRDYDAASGRSSA
jgi:ribosomal protein S18 acetylase RimI-like enzyme